MEQLFINGTWWWQNEIDDEIDDGFSVFDSAVDFVANVSEIVANATTQFYSNLASQTVNFISAALNLTAAIANASLSVAAYATNQTIQQYNNSLNTIATSANNLALLAQLFLIPGGAIFQSTLCVPAQFSDKNQKTDQ